ncbi:MAG: hypothetical protein ACSHYB_14610 [Roseibacillus sp.]
MIGMLVAALCFLAVTSGVRKRRVEIPLLTVDHMWGVNRKDLPFFYWLGMVLWLMIGLGFLAWGIFSL